MDRVETPAALTSRKVGEAVSLRGDRVVGGVADGAGEDVAVEPDGHELATVKDLEAVDLAHLLGAERLVEVVGVVGDHQDQALPEATAPGVSPAEHAPDPEIVHGLGQRALVVGAIGDVREAERGPGRVQLHDPAVEPAAHQRHELIFGQVVPLDVRAALGPGVSIAADA